MQHWLLRPHDINWRVNRVLAFEQPHSEIWPAALLEKAGFTVRRLMACRWIYTRTNLKEEPLNANLM
jgi:hypothetical protein